MSDSKEWFVKAMTINEATLAGGGLRDTLLRTRRHYPFTKKAKP
jgi:hypothetical protein